MKHEFKIINSRNESKNKRYSIFSHYYDNDKIECKIERPKSKNMSTNAKDYTSRNKVDNDTMEHAFELLNNRKESKDKNILFLVII